MRLAVRVERVEYDEPRADRLGRGEDGLLDPRHDIDLEVVADVDAVVHNRGALYRGPGAVRGGDVGGEPLDNFDRRPAACPVDEPDRVAAVDEFTGERGAGRACAENYLEITYCGHGVLPLCIADDFLQLLETVTLARSHSKRRC